MKILFFDLETSGLDFYENQIIEFGALLYEIRDNKAILLKEIDEFVNIGYSLSEDIVKLTHITDEMLLEKGISEYDLFCLIESLIDENTILSAYNIQFDITFITMLFRKYISKNFVFNNSLLDVLAVYKDLYPFPHRLKDAILKYDVDVKNTHRAIDDIKATVLVLKHLSLECDVKKYINVIGYHSDYGIFGIKMPHVLYIIQRGGCKEILNYKRVV